MTNKHTQGTWIADGAQIFTEEVNVAQANGYRVDRETVLANARLIAAAPELLEALKLFVNGQSKADFDAAHDAARSAIAKATGQ